MLKALLWKEWQEQRSRMALATIWLVGMTAIGLKTRILPDAGILSLIWFPTAIVLPAFLGMGLFASERKDGTLTYLMTQPVHRGHILLSKVTIGVLASILPFAFCGLTVFLALGGQEMSTLSLARFAAGVTAFSVVAFAWDLLLGLRCRREETFVLASALVLSCSIVYDLATEPYAMDESMSWLQAFSPFATLATAQGMSPQSSNIAMIAAAQGLTLIALGFGLWLRFRRLREGRK